MEFIDPDFTHHRALLPLWHPYRGGMDHVTTPEFGRRRAAEPEEAPRLHRRSATPPPAPTSPPPGSTTPRPNSTTRCAASARRVELRPDSITGSSLYVDGGLNQI
ncbi:hypothetical protein ACIRL2_50135 [Embleya sp. NPDC127516]|uniref:hypothetical protein n=1 Tax=Embleya sp. NPDC127516 TaxID=3363990 RepID=UPI00381D627B